MRRWGEGGAGCQGLWAGGIESIEVLPASLQGIGCGKVVQTWSGPANPAGASEGEWEVA